MILHDVRSCTLQWYILPNIVHIIAFGLMNLMGNVIELVVHA